MAARSTLRIVFFGTPPFAVASLEALLDAGCTVVGVVTAPDKPAGRGLAPQASAVKLFAQNRGLPILQPEKLKAPDFLEQYRALEPDLGVVVAFRMLPEVVWNSPPLGTVNVHASLLPQYRGAAPINWAVINGEKETGVTTFRLKHAIDTGDVLLQKRVLIGPDDTAGALHEMLMSEGAGLLVQTVQSLANGTLEPTPQASFSDGDLRHAPKIFREDCLIQWDLPAGAIHNRIRGLSPHPAAFTELGGKTLKIFRSRYTQEGHNVTPGHQETDGRTYLRVAAADGWVWAEEVQWEGKKRLSIADFLRGWRP